MPAITRRGPDDGCSRISANENFLKWTNAATPCGVSLGTVAPNSLSGSSSVSTWEPICGSRRAARGCADSLKKIARNFSPLRTASSMMRKPSIAHSPEEVSSLRLNAWRNSLTKALWRPSMRRKRPVSAWVDWVNRALPPQEIIRAYRRYAWAVVSLLSQTHNPGDRRARGNGQNQQRKTGTVANPVRRRSDSRRPGAGHAYRYV